MVETDEVHSLEDFDHYKNTFAGDDSYGIISKQRSKIARIIKDGKKGCQKIVA